LLVGSSTEGVLRNFGGSDFFYRIIFSVDCNNFLLKANFLDSRIYQVEIKAR